MTQHLRSALLCLSLVPLVAGCSLMKRPAPGGICPYDRVAITDLINNYSYTWDGRDTDAWVDLFTDDAVIQASFVGKLAWAHESTAERRAFMDGFYETMTKQGLIRSKHIQTGTVLTAQDDGSVRADTMFVVAFQYTGETTPRFTNTGVYKDRFVRTEDGWKFALRDIHVDQE